MKVEAGVENHNTCVKPLGKNSHVLDFGAVTKKPGNESPLLTITCMIVISSSCWRPANLSSTAAADSALASALAFIWKRTV